MHVGGISGFKGLTWYRWELGVNGLTMIVVCGQGLNVVGLT